MTEKEKLQIFEKKLNYKFKKIELLKIALIHKSYAYEIGTVNKMEYNERIEFLGDAILEHVISEMLYIQTPKLREGQMTKKRAAIVCETSLSIAMKRIGGQDFLYLGKCEETTNGKQKDAILADAMEAIIGAIYLDGGYECVKKFILNTLDKEIQIVLSGGNFNTDYKTKLQEKLQENGNVKIEYVLVDESGPEHDKVFKVELLFNDKKIGEGVGKSKKHAEQEAAKYALENSI